ncbi:LysR family transcriptional regulator [Janthinobacterium fluminis]|uniref:LysR substrate-binding domain-containing protein n=1 Tax=Janthinobacterium fluminis TaxID=2987524 RepID=A0ABT5JUW5_9BURK|nr:LysR family transcriptional regulator [Janthinobacterium fluminis]MDC8756424.1 LysR substrate-binding domain-containing protein [Janthinobacterium fluminis]
MDVVAAMRVFRQVVQRDSFSKAAEDLRQSAAAVSKQVRQLEERLGTLLILRTTRRMSLSEAGRVYYAECCRLLDELDALERATAAGAGAVAGCLRVNAPLSFGLKVLSPLLAEFMARYPQLRVELTLNDRLLDVVTEGFDVSLRVRTQLADSSLVARRLGEVEQLICAAPAYLARRGTPQRAEDLRGHDCLAYRLAEHPGVWQLEGDEGAVSIALPTRLSADNSMLLADMLVAGLGVGSLPCFIARPLIDSGALVSLLPGRRMARRGIYALYPDQRHPQQKVRVFVDFLAEALSAA